MLNKNDTNEKLSRVEIHTQFINFFRLSPESLQYISGLIINNTIHIGLQLFHKKRINGLLKRGKKIFCGKYYTCVRIHIYVILQNIHLW